MHGNDLRSIRFYTGPAAIVSLCLGVSAANAAPTLDCRNPIDQITLNQCAEKSYLRADQELNSKYQQVIKGFKDDSKTINLLREAQRAWIAFRDAECRLEIAAVEGGTITSMIFSGCMEKRTRQRLVDFAPYLDCRRGGVDCPATTRVKPPLQSRPATQPAEQAP